MRTCKRCKTNEAVKGSLNCEKCNERNKKHTAKLIAESEVEDLHIPVVGKSLADYGAYGGLGSELESENVIDANHYWVKLKSRKQ